jgi:hypothetical protein
MRLKAILTALLVAASLTAGALAATTKDPLRVVLRPADVPAGKGTRVYLPTFDRALRPLGLHTKTAYFAYTLYQGTTRAKHVSGMVVVTPSRAQARRVYALLKEEAAAEAARTTRLAPLGDQQLVTLTREHDPDVLVLRGTVVWQVGIRALGLEAYTRAQALKELQGYARKQKLRVGNG